MVYEQGDGVYELPLIKNKDAYVLLILEGNKLAFKKAEDVKPVDGVEVMVPVSRSFANADEVRDYIRKELGR
jgi:hypothetical protein